MCLARLAKRRRRTAFPRTLCQLGTLHRSGPVQAQSSHFLGFCRAQQLAASYSRLRVAEHTTTMGLFDFITTPTSYQNAQAMASFARRDQVSLASTAVTLLGEKLPPHSQHPNFGHLTLLVFEAVLEVVCVSLPGYLVARQGLFDAESQKFLANLNVTLFTPCLSIAFETPICYSS